MSFPKEGITIKAQNKIIIENLKKAIDSSGRKKSGSLNKWAFHTHLYGDSLTVAEN